MPKTERWPAEIVTHKTLSAKIDFDPKTGAPHGIMVWRNDKTTHDIDDLFYEISRKASRVMQRRYP